MRSALLFVIGLFVGVMGTVVGVNAMRQGTPFHHGVMAVMNHHSGALKRSLEAGLCTQADMGQHLASLQTMSLDLEPAFLPTQDDARFKDHAEMLRSALSGAATTLPEGCQAFGPAFEKVGATCKACHQDFR